MTGGDEPTQPMDEVAPGDGTIDGTVLALGEAFTDLEDRLAALEETEQSAQLPFDKWLDHLANTYDLEHTLRDWASVPGVRAELEALHANWLSAHDRELKPKVGSGAVNWHDSLARVLERLDWWRTRAKRNA